MLAPLRPFPKHSRGAPRLPKSGQTLELSLHIGAEDGVDAGLVSGAAAKPAQQVGVEAHGNDFFRFQTFATRYDRGGKRRSVSY
jgi:hypothetical protein